MLNHSYLVNSRALTIAINIILYISKDHIINIRNKNLEKNPKRQGIYISNENAIM